MCNQWRKFYLRRKSDGHPRRGLDAAGCCTYAQCRSGTGNAEMAYAYHRKNAKNRFICLI